LRKKAKSNVVAPRATRTVKDPNGNSGVTVPILDDDDDVVVVELIVHVHMDPFEEEEVDDVDEDDVVALPVGGWDSAPFALEAELVLIVVVVELGGGWNCGIDVVD
jgi:hypothetical protein